METTLPATRITVPIVLFVVHANRGSIAQAGFCEASVKKRDGASDREPIQVTARISDTTPWQA